MRGSDPEGASTDPARRSARIHWPAVLTVLRIVLAIPVVVLTLRQTDLSSYIAFVAFAVAALTDGLDGFAARKMGLVSTAGQYWDPIADKALLLVSMAGLVVVGRLPVWAALIIVVRESAVSVLRTVAERRGRGFPASKTAKAKTFAQLVAVLLYILPAGALPSVIETSMLWLAVVLTVISGVMYLRLAPRLLSDAR